MPAARATLVGKGKAVSSRDYFFGASVPALECQFCGSDILESVLSLGYMPPVNQMVPLGQVPRQQP